MTRRKEGGDGLGQGVGGAMGWGKLGGAGTTLLWQQTDWQKCKQLWCKEKGERRRARSERPLSVINLPGCC